MEYNRAQAIRQIDASYAAGKISRKEHDKKAAAVRKAYAEYEAQWIAQMKGQYAQNQAAMASSSPAYSYTPPPQFEYVQGPAHHPGGGYTPQPQQMYVQTPQHQPGGGYTPQPQQMYVQTPQHQPGGGYTPQPQQMYVQTPQHQPGGGYTPQDPPKYNYNKDPSPKGTSSYGAVPQTTQQYDLSSKPLTLTAEQRRERSDESIQRTTETALKAGKTIYQVEKGSVWGGIKSFFGFGKAAVEQAKDFQDPTGRTGLVPPQGPAPAKRPQWLEDDLKKYAPDYPR